MAVNLGPIAAHKAQLAREARTAPPEPELPYDARGKMAAMEPQPFFSELAMLDNAAYETLAHTEERLGELFNAMGFDQPEWDSPPLSISGAGAALNALTFARQRNMLANRIRDMVIVLANRLI